MAQRQPEKLHIRDLRTGKEYFVPVDDNFVKATDLSAIRGPASATKIGDGPKVVRETSLGVFDRGFAHTACMESSITKIDGWEGIVTFRDIPLEKLFRENDFDDTIHLLIWGDIPSPSKKKEMQNAIAAHMDPPQIVLKIVQSFPRDADPFAIVIACLGAYASMDADCVAARHAPAPKFHSNMKQCDKAIIRTLAYIATIFALVYCHRMGQAFTAARSTGSSYLGNLLRMMGFEVSEDERTSEAGRRLHCLQRLWILYADHEMTNSTAACLHTGSTLTDPVSCLMSTIISGAGPLHVGAIELAYDVVDMIGSAENVPQYIQAVKDKKMRLFGYGHRVYKTRDPRAVLLTELMDEHKDKLSSPLLEVALAVDKVASSDEYFVQRNLKVNVDLFGCFIYMAFGIPKELLPGLVMMSRIPGVMAHWREAMGQSIKIWRPRQKYKPASTTATGKTDGFTDGTNTKL